MHLKQVRLTGFKTFADRTEFSLDGPITAVVGPNGCGKSNLVDAILWGLGEGNARNLRAGSHQDVIFNGAANRKPVGFAEVTLTFSNEDRALPVDTSEVVISRRLTRTGDSNYSINKQNCRQRDIYELLADSGLGRSGYAIVGQKEIDAAVAASAEDRRAWIDEAAGVQRYRIRKQESQRKLNATEVNLRHLQDLLREIGLQREPLRTEAERATHYKGLQSALQAVEADLLMREAWEAAESIRQLSAQIERSIGLIVEESARAESAENQAHAVQAEVSRMEQELDDLRVRLQGSLSRQERAVSSLQLTQQRLESSGDQRATLEEDTTALQNHVLVLREEYRRAEADYQQARQLLETLRAESAGSDDEGKRLAANLKRVEDELRHSVAQEMRELQLSAESKVKQERLRAIGRELDGIRKAIPELEEALSEAQDTHAAAAEALSAFDEAMAAATVALAQHEAELREIEAKERAVLAEMASVDGQIRGIEATLASHEGLSQGSRAVLNAVATGQLSGEYIPVSEAIRSDRDVALAIETALGGSVNDLIVASEREAKAAVEFLKRTRAGRCTFQPLSLMRPTDVSPELQRVLDGRGILGRASSLVTFDGKYRPAVESLLGRVLVAETIDDALAVAKTRGWSRIVTLEGEVIHSSGAVTGGTTQRSSYGVVQRKADLRELEDQQRSLANERGRLGALKDRHLKERDRQERELIAKRANRAGLVTEAEDAKVYLRTLQEELNSTRRSEEKLVREQDDLADRHVGREVFRPSDEVRADRDLLLAKIAARAADADQVQLRLREHEERLEIATAAYQSADKRLRNAETELSNRNSKLQTFVPLRQQLEEQVAELVAQIKQYETESGALDTELKSLSEARSTALESSFRLSEEAKALRANVSALTTANHQAEISRTRLETKRAAALERLLDAYGIGEAECMERGPSVEVVEDAANVCARLRREMKSMGEVNLGAIDAFEQVNARWEELHHQVTDVEESLTHLRDSIKELDGLVLGKFSTTFEEVQAAFRQTFARIFDGGSGEVVLTDTENALDSGVDLEITLPGKKRQNLALLSGGERSLCACAFLFALLQVKPSPLVILDEVDAPLDGRNVERFAQLLRESTLNTQFIVITHNLTTIEAAPTWLGVTMAEPGVSRLIPARLPDAKEEIRQRLIAEPEAAPVSA